MINEIKATYKKCTDNGCHFLIDDEKFKIVETHDSFWKIDNTVEYENFLVENPNKKQLNYLAIDKCLFDDLAKHKRCDCAVFDDTTFSLIEIKDSDSDNTRSKLLSKAYDQLEDVLKEFTSSLNFEKYALEAIIAFKYKPVRPLASVTLQTKIAKFKKKYNARILIGNSKTFV